MTSHDDTLTQTILVASAHVILDKHHPTASLPVLAQQVVDALSAEVARHPQKTPEETLDAVITAMRTVSVPAVASKSRFRVLQDESEVSLVPVLAGRDEAAEQMPLISIVGGPDVTTQDLLKAAGFETYEVLPDHIATPIAAPCPAGTGSLPALQRLLLHVGELQGLPMHLAYIASVAAIQKLLQENFRRSGSLRFATTLADTLDYLRSIDLKAAGINTSVMVLSATKTLVTATDLPTAVLGYVGSNTLNVIEGPELPALLQLPVAVETQGSELFA